MSTGSCAVDTSFTPAASLVGGLLIGAATGALFVSTGRLVGISSVLDGVLKSWVSGGKAPSDRAPGKSGKKQSLKTAQDCQASTPTTDDEGWKSMFLSGLTAGGLMAGTLHPAGFDQMGIATSWGINVAAGLLVGAGTRLSNGCTSGHGVAGLARLSHRSLVAVLTFMTAGAAVGTVAGASGVACWGLGPGREAGGDGGTPASPEDLPFPGVRTVFAAVSLILGLGPLWRRPRAWKADLASFASGSLFAAGLALSGMAQRPKVLNFLRFRPGPGAWDPSLALVMGGAVPVVAAALAAATRLLGAPLLATATAPAAAAAGGGDGGDSGAAGGRAEGGASAAGGAGAGAGGKKAGESKPHTQQGLRFVVPRNTELDVPLVVGAWLFGAGWGLGGLCPGPAWLAAAWGFPKVAFGFLPAMAAGMLSAPFLRSASLPQTLSCRGVL